MFIIDINELEQVFDIRAGIVTIGFCCAVTIGYRIETGIRLDSMLSGPNDCLEIGKTRIAWMGDK